jgi:hypothetical protein
MFKEMDFCTLCGENDVTNEALICNKCKFTCCTECLPNQGLCKECISELCQICNINKDHEMYCKQCHRTYCFECIAITGCQTECGICKECFDYKCEICGKTNLTKTYLWDCPEHQPICDECSSHS